MNNQMNSAVRKIHNLLSSGAVTVTGPNQPRILKQKVVGSGSGGGTTIAASNPTANNLQQIVSSTAVNNGNRCYVCDDILGANQAQNQLTEMQTSHSATKFPNKIGQLVGDAFMVIVSVEDVVCARCTNLINYLDRLENDVERVRTNLMNLLHKKYGLNDDSAGNGNGTGANANTITSPPNKLLKLNSGAAVNTVQQQMKISTPSPTSTGTIIHQQSAGTQTLQRKTTKIYKCLSCDYKTSDMRLFNTHYETCKPQNFQCKNCKKIFPNFGAMKLHMVREHNTPMDNTCAVCHINFATEAALRKHMEMNHSTSVVVTSTTTVPLNPPPVVDGTGTNTHTTPLYTCNHCQFKSTDKIMFDEHMRKHVAGIKSKPFKCRLCAQRFETREAATTHAKQHQGNVFKCGTCSLSFTKRELLVKHFEVHQQATQQQPQLQIQQQPQVVQQQQHHQVMTVKQQGTQQNILTTQKLLQDTIDEALSDTNTSAPVITSNVNSDISNTGGGSGSSSTGTTSANNIRFFSCHICSLTFIQEHYYNQHMETHQRSETNVKKNSNNSNSNTNNNNSNNNAIATIANAAALVSETSSQLDMNEMHSNNKLGSHPQLQQQQLQQQSNITNSNNTISEADIESIFEKMHSDKGESMSTATTAATNRNNEHVVITSQAGQGGGITFNITIPGGQEQDPDTTTTITTTTSSNRINRQQDQSKHVPATTAPVSLSIDMPMLDQPDDGTITPTSTTAAMLNNIQSAKTTTINSGPVSMPSLDDDNEEANSPTSGAQQQTATSSIQMNEDVKDVMKKEEINVGMDEHHSTIKTRDHHQDVNETSIDHAVKVETSTTESNSGEGEGGGIMSSGGEERNTNNTGEEATMSVVVPASEDTAEDNVAAQDHMVTTDDQHQVAMELDEATMQAQVDGGQIKFILNESGQLLQLDNHIITDAEGNQILVQDPEQIQQLLQSVGVLQSADGLDGETLQMVTDGNGQMVLVHGENNEAQLIDASLLNAEGQLVIQQSQDGDGAAHVIGEDGTRIPVSVSYTEDGQPIVQVQQQVLEAAGGPESMLEKENAEGTDVVGVGNGGNTSIDDTTVQHTVTTTSGGNSVEVGVGGTTSGGFFALEELMQQSSSSATTTTATTAIVASNVTQAKTD